MGIRVICGIISGFNKKKETIRKVRVSIKIVNIDESNAYTMKSNFNVIYPNHQKQQETCQQHLLSLIFYKIKEVINTQ